MAIEHLQVSFDTSDVLLYILSFFLPPLAVLIRKGFWSSHFFLNILLTLFFGLPGLLHALYVVYTTSPITGNQSRRVEDYERLIESEEYQPQETTTTTTTYQDSSYTPADNVASSSDNQAPPPAYENNGVAHVNTDNKVQN